MALHGAVIRRESLPDLRTIICPVSTRIDPRDAEIPFGPKVGDGPPSPGIYRDVVVEIVQSLPLATCHCLAATCTCHCHATALQIKSILFVQFSLACLLRKKQQEKEASSVALVRSVAENLFQSYFRGWVVY